MIEAFPLCWPQGWPRTPDHRRIVARFTKGERKYPEGGGSSWVTHRALTVADGLKRVQGELRRFGVAEREIIISTNLPVRQDGLPYSNATVRGDKSPGVAVYWTRVRSEGQRVMAIDLYTTVADNLAAVAATLDAMRAIERHGGAQILERAFTGFAALPDFSMGRPWRDVLGDCASVVQVEAAFRELASSAHPDKGGTDERMAELNRAREEAKRELMQ